MSTGSEEAIYTHLIYAPRLRQQVHKAGKDRHRLLASGEWGDEHTCKAADGRCQQCGTPSQEEDPLGASRCQLLVPRQHCWHIVRPSQERVYQTYQPSVAAE